MDDIETGDYNNDTNINDLKNINLKKNIRDTTIGQKKSKILEFIKKETI